MERQPWPPTPDQLPDTLGLEGKTANATSIVNGRIINYSFTMTDGTITYRTEGEAGDTMESITPNDERYGSYCRRMLNILQRKAAAYGGSGDWPG